MVVAKDRPTRADAQSDVVSGPHDQAATEPLLYTEQLGMAFPGGVRALESVDIEVHAGDFLVILGPSGAGKSTLLRSLNRLNRPTSGKVFLDGREITTVSGPRLRRVRQQVGMVFQQFNLVGRLTVLQNVLSGRLARLGVGGFCLSHLRLYLPSQQHVALEALRQVGILDKAYQRVDTLSGGQQQRVAIARLLAQEPQVILADEPIASLDPASAQSVMDSLRTINLERGIPVVVNLHQVTFARRYATRIIGIQRGRVVFNGPPEQLDPETERRLYDKAQPTTMQAPEAQSLENQAHRYESRLQSAERRGVV